VITLHRERLRAAVCEAYTKAALAPQSEHRFPVGRTFAESLDYPATQLQTIPSISIEAFSGVSNVSIFANFPPSSRVLDLGCGAGFDSLIAGRRVGADGLVVGVDFSQPMLLRARSAALQANAANVHFCRAAGESLPIKSGAVDVAIVNGFFNLNPARTQIFTELARVVRLGGFVYAAELILIGPLPPEVQASEDNWFA